MHLQVGKQVSLTFEVGTQLITDKWETSIDLHSNCITLHVKKRSH